MAYVVGQEYVMGGMLAGRFHPTSCNSKFSPQHDCRVTLLSASRVWGTALMSGSSKPQKVRLDALFPVDDAKAAYRKTLEHYGHARGQIDAFVEAL